MHFDTSNSHKYPFQTIFIQLSYEIQTEHCAPSAKFDSLINNKKSDGFNLKLMQTLMLPLMYIYLSFRLYSPPPAVYNVPHITEICQNHDDDDNNTFKCSNTH